MRNCVTHHICDCLGHKLELAENVIAAAREISCGNHVNCKEHGYAALHTTLKEYEAAFPIDKDTQV